MLNPNIERWIFASISKHFDDRKGSKVLYIEGMHRDTRTLESFIELRIDGPYYTEMSKDYWKVYIEVNVLIQCTKNNQDFHRMRQLSGEVMNMFEPCINIYKFGPVPPIPDPPPVPPDPVLNDGSFIGTFTRMDREEGRNNMQVSQFGQVDPVNQLEQATVEAHYVMHLEE